jgi:sporulation protein YlmC with PRC-barrel domain
MVLSELLGAQVVDRNGRRVGRVRDVGLTPRRGGSRGGDLELRVASLLIGPGGLAERLGYAYGPVRGPWLLRAVLMRRARRLKSAPWGTVARIGHRRIELSVATGDLTHPRDTRPP